MAENAFQYSADITRTDGTKLGAELLNVDWEPALECARFEAFRAAAGDSGARSLTSRSTFLMSASCRIDPVWDTDAGRPKVSGFRVSVSPADGPPTAIDFPKSYFRAAAGRAAAPYVDSGQLTEGGVFHFVPSAHPGQTPVDVVRDRLVAGDVAERWPVSEARLAESLEVRQASYGQSGDVPVVFPATLLDEAGSRSRLAGDVETGAVLVGHLRHDPTTREIFVEVTAQLPACHTVAEMTRLEFTARTWTEARRLVGMRARGEVMLGWWHSHVGRAVCRNCSAASRRVCQFARGFFSAHDRHFQRTAFPRAYHLGLVVNDPASGDVSWSLFGWRRGEIVSRGFLATRAGEAKPPVELDATETSGGPDGPR